MEVIQKLSTLINHAKQATSRVVIVFVLFEMFGEVNDARGQ